MKSEKKKNQKTKPTMHVEKQSKLHLMLWSQKVSYQSICWTLIMSIYTASVPITELATKHRDRTFKQEQTWSVLHTQGEGRWISGVVLILTSGCHIYISKVKNLAD